MLLHFPVPPITDNRAAKKTAATTQTEVTAFRDCYQRFQECLEYRDVQNNTLTNGLAESYLLDFGLAAKRAIGNHTSRYQLFQMRYLQGANRQDCCKTLGLEVFTYASEIIQIERVVGRALAQRGMFPLASYFAPVERQMQRKIA